MRLNGSYSNEFEAAHDMSRRTTDRNPDSDRIAALIAEGRCVVVTRYPMYCRLTDGFIGNGTGFVSSFIDRDNADHAASVLTAELSPGDEHHYEVLPKLPPTPRVAIAADDDCPF